MALEAFMEDAKVKKGGQIWNSNARAKETNERALKYTSMRVHVCDVCLRVYRAVLFSFKPKHNVLTN